jgi:hypothetical protein
MNACKGTRLIGIFQALMPCLCIKEKLLLAFPMLRERERLDFFSQQGAERIQPLSLKRIASGGLLNPGGAQREVDSQKGAPDEIPGGNSLKNGNLPESIDGQSDEAQQ